MKILLLEDDAALNKSIKDALHYSGYDVDNFFDGDDVLQALGNIYDLYILDVNVPNINGLELLGLIQNQNRASKVIIITSNIDLKTIQTAYDLGCIDYLKKPFHLEELRFKIDRLKLENLGKLDGIKLTSNPLSKKERKFLLLLLENKGKVVDYETIAERVYQDKVMSMDALRTLAKRLRGKLEEDIIKNIVDEGYMVV
ncbi:MAG: response regulator transcription factor [Arcobacteraceae bacterium]|nr:response regulator transcription factor [Arcobacteraceae bacterium]